MNKRVIVVDTINTLYKVTDVQSFQNVSYWMRQIGQNAPKDVEVFVVANKCDRRDYRIITSEEGEALARHYSAQYFECSAKSGAGVYDLYKEAARTTAKRAKARSIAQDKLQVTDRAVKGGHESRTCPGCVIL